MYQLDQVKASFHQIDEKLWQINDPTQGIVKPLTVNPPSYNLILATTSIILRSLN